MTKSIRGQKMATVFTVQIGDNKVVVEIPKSAKAVDQLGNALDRAERAIFLLTRVS